LIFYFAVINFSKYIQTNKMPKKHTLEEVKQIFTNRHCKLLSTVYHNSSDNLLYQCSCGEICTTTLHAFGSVTVD